MKRPESKFASPMTTQTARHLGSSIRAARLARNATQASMAERARMSALTLLKIERGDVSVAFGSWLAAMEQAGLLPLLRDVANPDADRLGSALRREQARVRARPSGAGSADFDF